MRGIYVLLIALAAAALLGVGYGPGGSGPGGGGGASLDGCSATAGNLVCTADIECSGAGCQFVSTPSLTAPDAITLCERGNNGDGGACEGPAIAAADTDWTTTKTLIIEEDGTFSGDFETSSVSGSLDEPGTWTGAAEVELENVRTIGSCISATGTPTDTISVSCPGVYRFWFDAWVRFDYTTDTNAAMLGLYWAETDQTPIHPNANYTSCNGSGSAVTNEIANTHFEAIYQVTAAPQTFAVFGWKCAGATSFNSTASKSLNADLTSFGVERIK